MPTKDSMDSGSQPHAAASARFCRLLSASPRETFRVSCDVSVSSSNNKYTHDAVPVGQHYHQDKDSKPFIRNWNIHMDKNFLQTLTDYLADASIQLLVVRP
jgi:hypothetical protein